MPAFLAALVAVGSETALSLERLAEVIAPAAGVAYSKQALHQRLTAKIEGFLTAVATALFQQAAAPAKGSGSAPFPASCSRTAPASLCPRTWPRPSRAAATSAAKKAAL
jgi:hypothetical protein